MFTKFAAGVLCLVLFQDVGAALTVVDVKNLRRQILNYARLVEQINNQRVQIGQMGDAIRIAERHVRAITGNKGVSALLNTQSFRAPRRALPVNIQGTLDALAAGRVPRTSAEIRRGLQALLALWDLFQDYDALPYAARQAALRKTRREDLALNSVGVVAADEAIAISAANVETLEALIAAIDGTADLKHSVDLNSRIQAEAALIANQLLHIQSLQLRRAAAEVISRDKAANLSRVRLMEGE